MHFTSHSKKKTENEREKEVEGSVGIVRWKANKCEYQQMKLYVKNDKNAYFVSEARYGMLDKFRTSFTQTKWNES